MPHLTTGRGNMILESMLAGALNAIDDRICTPEAKALLEVNRRGRIVPTYRFVPSDRHPEAYGRAPIGVEKVHKRVGKKNSSKRGR